MKISKNSLFFTLNFVLICAFFAAAREYSGVVVDSSGKPIQGVFVSVGHTEFYARTDQTGKFTIKNATTAVSERHVSKAEPQKARLNFRGRTLDLSSAPTVTSASIYAINGKRVFNSLIPSSRVVGLPGLAMGAYMLELRGEQGALYRTQIVLANQTAASFTLGSALTPGGGPRLTKSTQTLAAVSELLIFRHDDYWPRDSVMTGSNTNMRVELKSDERSFIFDQSKVREYRFTIDPTDLNYMNTRGYREEFKPATLTFEGRTYPNIGIRYKGSDYTLPRCFFNAGFSGNVDTNGTPNKTCKKISYKLKFTEYNKEMRFYGMKKINLHAFAADPTKMHEILSYELFRDMGIHAPRVSYANVYVNGNLMGLFLAVEEIDGRFTKSRWPDNGDGNLYKEVWPRTADANYYLDGLKTNDGENDNPNVQKMVAYYNAVNSSNEQNFVPNLSPYMDFDYLLRYLAVDVAIKNWDGMRSWYWDNNKRQGNNHNYFFYEEEAKKSNGKIWIIPWDMDQALTSRDNYFDAGGYGGALPQWNVPTTDCGNPKSAGGNSFMPPNCDKLTKLTAANFWSRYVQLGDLFLNDVFVSQRLNDKITKHQSLIDNAMRQDPNLKQGESYNSWTNDVSSLKNYLPNNISQFRSYIHP